MVLPVSSARCAFSTAVPSCPAPGVTGPLMPPGLRGAVLVGRQAADGAAGRSLSSSAGVTMPSELWRRSRLWKISRYSKITLAGSMRGCQLPPLRRCPLIGGCRSVDPAARSAVAVRVTPIDLSRPMSSRRPLSEVAESPVPPSPSWIYTRWCAVLRSPSPVCRAGHAMCVGESNPTPALGVPGVSRIDRRLAVLCTPPRRLPAPQPFTPAARPPSSCAGSACPPRATVGPERPPAAVTPPLAGLESLSAPTAAADIHVDLPQRRHSRRR